MVENRSNIAWYLPVGYTAKLLPIFQQIAEWKNGEATKNDPARPVNHAADDRNRLDHRNAGPDRAQAD